MIPENPEHRTEAVMATHAAVEANPLGVTERLIHADALDDAGDVKGAALQRMLAEPASETRAEDLLRAHGGDHKSVAQSLSAVAHELTIRANAASGRISYREETQRSLSRAARHSAEANTSASMLDKMWSSDPYSRAHTEAAMAHSDVAARHTRYVFRNSHRLSDSARARQTAAAALHQQATTAHWLAADFHGWYHDVSGTR